MRWFCWTESTAHEFHLLIGRSAPMVSALRFLCNITLNFYAARLFKGENLGNFVVSIDHAPVT